MSKTIGSMGRSTAIALLLGVVGLCGLVGMAQAHPGHAAPDIIHGLDALAAAATNADAEGQGAAHPVSLWLALLGAGLLMWGPVARRAGRELPSGVLRMTRGVGVAMAACAVVLALVSI